MSSQNDVVGRIRNNWRQRASEKTTFWGDLRLVPRWLVWFLVVTYVAALAALFHFDLGNGQAAGMTLPQMAEKELVGFGLVTAIAIVISAFVLLIAYIGADAKRRGMNPVLWELVAFLVPYLIGIALYFVVREPLPFNCPRCGRTLTAQFNFCPACQFNLRPSCPQCRGTLHPGDRFCPHCGFTLQTEAAAPTGTEPA
jgi:RNA polymerase subunit RPABC4/transcription elongation factor Spt4